MSITISMKDNKRTYYTFFLTSKNVLLSKLINNSNLNLIPIMW